MFCSRISREGWTLVYVIDLIFLLKDLQPGHCRRMEEWENQ